MSWARDRWWADGVVEDSANIPTSKPRVEIRQVSSVLLVRHTVRLLSEADRQIDLLVTTRDPNNCVRGVREGLEQSGGDSRRVRLGVLVHTQAELQRAVVWLGGIRIYLRTLVLEPHEGLDLREAGVDRTLIDWIVLRGPREPRDVAMHPRWVDRIIGDARRLEVPIWWESWGRWVPHRSGERRRHQDVVAVYESGAMEPCRGIAGSAPLGAVMMRDDPGAKAPELDGWEPAQEPRMEATT